MTRPARPEISYQSEPPPRMTYQQYVLLVTAILVALSAQAAIILAPFAAIRLARRDWLELLALVYPLVVRSRRDIGRLARAFYDSERARHIGSIRIRVLDPDMRIIGPNGRPIRVNDQLGSTIRVWPRQDMIIPPYDPDRFESEMNAVIDRFIATRVRQVDRAAFIAQLLKSAEQAGRVGTLWAVENDPQVLGWARVEGNENVGSCGFCATLISRGPVYKSARSAGLDVPDTARAVELTRQADATGNYGLLNQLMTRWHPNCDCRVVPVFDTRSWPGIDRYQEFEALWREVTRGFRGNDALNAMRRAIESGRSPLRRIPVAA